MRNLYQTHVLKDLMKPRTGESYVFVQNGGGLKPLEQEAKVNPSLEAGVKASTLISWLPLEVTKMQKFILDKMPTLDWIEPNRSSAIRNRLAEAELELAVQTTFFEREHRLAGGFII